MGEAGCGSLTGSVYSASVTYRDRQWPVARPGRSMALAVLALTTALAAAGCSAGRNASPAALDRQAAPALTQAEAAQVFSHYTAVMAEAARTKDDKLALSVVTGVQRAVVGGALNSHAVAVGSGGFSAGGPPADPASSDPSGAYSSTLTIEFSFISHSYRDPLFYLPEPAGYPRFFVVRASQAVPGVPAGLGANTVLGETEQPLDGTALLLFEQASSGAPWLLASASELTQGQALPRLATGSNGYVPVVKPTAALAAPLNSVGALQAAAVDEGPASAAMKAVSPGPLTTGIYEGAQNHADGLRPPAGDVYQWQLAGTSDPVFALRTAAGAALTFYTMTMTETVAVPDVINKADPIRSGPSIQIPQDLAPLLPKNQQPPLQELQSEQELSFAAIDPAQTTATISVIAIGGGLTAASDS
jgi:hypothetical protein